MANKKRLHPLVSICIPTYNRKRIVGRLLESIASSKYKNLEIIVVDDCSSDGTIEYLRKAFGTSIQLLENKKNSGVTAARSRALKAATGKYIFFIDDDNVIDANCIETLVSWLERDDTILMAGPVMYYYSEPSRIWWAGTQRNMRTSRTRHLYRKGDLPNMDSWETVDFPNAWMFRASLKPYAYFDHRFVTHYEESDFAYRLHSNVDGKFLVIKKAIIFHDFKPDDPAGLRRRYLDKRRVFYTAKNRIIFHKRYASKKELFWFITFWMWLFVGYYLIFLLRCDLGGKWRNLEMATAYLWGTFSGLLSKV